MRAVSQENNVKFLRLHVSLQNNSLQYKFYSKFARYSLVKVSWLYLNSLIFNLELCRHPKGRSTVDCWWICFQIFKIIILLNILFILLKILKFFLILYEVCNFKSLNVFPGIQRPLKTPLNSCLCFYQKQSHQKCFDELASFRNVVNFY